MATRAQIRRLASRGLTRSQIASRLGISGSRVVSALGGMMPAAYRASTSSGGGGGGNQSNSNNAARQQAINTVGTNRFTAQDFRTLQRAGIGANRTMRIAASSRRVGQRANNRLMQLNPGIRLPARSTIGSSTSFDRLYGGLDQLGRMTELGKQIKKLPKNYYQWQGTDAKGRPLGLQGYRVPKKLRKGDPYEIGVRATNRGSYSALNGTGTLFGRGGGSVLNSRGTMRNTPTSWRPTASGNMSGGGGGGNQSSGGGGGSGGSGGGSGDFGGFGDYGNYPSMPAAPAPEAIPTSTTFGGSGTDVYNSANIRTRRSRARRDRSFTQGPSRLGINLQRRSGLNIMRA